MSEKVPNSSTKPKPEKSLQKMIGELDTRMDNYVQNTMHSITLEDMIHKARGVTAGYELISAYGEIEFIKAITQIYNENKPFIT